MNVFKLSVTFVKSLSTLFVPGKCPKRIDHEKNVAGESLASDSTPSDIIGYLKAQQPHYDLLRFLDAQEFAYTQALSELKGGRKQSHWIWYIFPQQKGLGHSYNSKYYAWMARVKPEPMLNMKFWVIDSVNAARRSCSTRIRTSNISWEAELTC